jgi:hypothetical protein
MLTIFSPPKPFLGHIDVIQRNAIQSWIQLGEQVQVLLIGDEQGMAEVSAEFGVQQLSDVKRNELGTPLVSSIFQLAREHAIYSTLCYVNADIIFLDDLMNVVRKIDAGLAKFLMIGQRWDLDIKKQMTFDENWQTLLRQDLEGRGRLHPPAGSDYFVYKSEAFRNMPPLALGRAGWDNWMIFAARAEKIPVVDVTGSVTVIHQDHDYAHLPDGQPHYRLPESNENVRLSGGPETIFTLSDADWVYFDGEVRRKPWRARWSRRGLEASLLSAFGPGSVARFFRMFFHPIDACRYYWHALGRYIKGGVESRKEMNKERD